ncbi:hypothetical protein C9374_005559 [Naegleria lovaniensis]|uniref:Uncharacterized protein n=1 Tax=Naegleria lovaniensis TaxID=51637 RepID=A0AA88GQ65_NAELO|nr:uncharacterized protein C9374_005559 [Naegleria lovaniensis]KAG2382357.1 hypothetical protein C9374_005559 [Naegleria lovaniensis]
MNVTFSGNVGIEKAAGGVLKKGKINLLVDMSIKVIVFNNYLFSKRGLNLILNGIRERERINRSSILDEDLERARNNATLEMPTTKNYTTYDNSFTGKLKTMVKENVQPHLDKKIEKKREEIVDSMISKGGISETAVKLVIE